MTKNSKLNNYIKISTEEDIFKNIKDAKKLKKLAFDYLLNGNTNYEIITDVIDNKVIKFIRISAQEYVYGKQSRILSQHDCNHHGLYNYKMRMVPSIDDLISNAKIKYQSPLMHISNLFINGFNNFQGEVLIDDSLFKYIVRIGRARRDNIFYDINLEYRDKVKEIEQTVPDTKYSMSLIKGSISSETNIS